MRSGRGPLLVAYILVFTVPLFFSMLAVGSHMRNPLSGVSVAFGPYATLVAMLFHVPNAGEFFSWIAAAVLTVLLPLLMLISLRTANRNVAILTAIATFILTIVWIGYADMQILCCVA